MHGNRPYDDFVAQFLAGHAGWQPEPWADLFEAAGARYVVLVTKHHDGVLLWPSDTPNPHKERWASERDLVGDLAASVRARDMRFGTYYSGGLDWTFGGLPMTDFQAMFNAIPQTPEYLAYADAHWRELIERYQPDVLWNDIGYPAAADLDGLFADYYAAVPDGVVNNRFDWMAQTAGAKHCDFVTPEYSTKGDPGAEVGEHPRHRHVVRLQPPRIGGHLPVARRAGPDVRRRRRPRRQPAPQRRAERRRHHPVGAGAAPARARAGGCAPTARPSTAPARGRAPTGVTGEGHDVRFTDGRRTSLYAIVCGTPTLGRRRARRRAVAAGATSTSSATTLPLPWEPTGDGCRA